MARTKALKRIAQNLLKGSCIRTAEFYRDTAKGTEYVKVQRGKVAVEEFFATKPEKDLDVAKPALANNGLPLQGYIMVDRTPVEFYGSEKAFKAMLAMD